MGEKKEIPYTLYRCLALRKMLKASHEGKCEVNLSRDAVEQWAKEYLGEEWLEKQIEKFSVGKENI